MNKLNRKDMAKCFCALRKKFFPLTLNHSRADRIKAQAWRWCFLQVEWTKGEEDFLPLGIHKCALREKCLFQKTPVSEQTALLPSLSSHLCTFTPKLLQIRTHSCRLTASYCSASPSPPTTPFLGWILHSRDSCTLRAQWNPLQGLPAPPIFHELGPDTSMRGKTMSETLPALAPGLVRVTQLPPAACPSTRHFTKQTDPWRLSMLLGVTAARMFSQPLAPTGSRLRRESFLLLLFCFYFLWMALGEKCRRKHNTTAIHKKGKETSRCLEIFWDASKLQDSVSLEASPGPELNVAT